MMTDSICKKGITYLMNHCMGEYDGRIIQGTVDFPNGLVI